MKILLVLFLFLLGLFAYYGLNFYQKFSTAQRLIAKATPFESTNSEKTMLVLGDSTAVGVGADKNTDTVPALLSNSLRFSVENLAVSGAKVADLDGQMSKAAKDQYDLVLVMIGANDLIRFANAESVATVLRGKLEKLPSHEKLIVVLSAGNLGGAKLFPFFIRPFHSRLNQDYHREFASVVEEAGGEYVNLYESPETDPFIREPRKYLAADGLHPSSSGYEIWFHKIMEQIDLR